MDIQGFSAGKVAAVAAGAYTAIPLTDDDTSDAMSVAWPKCSYLDRIELEVTDFPVGLDVVLAKLTYDAAGDFPASLIAEESAVQGETLATKGSVIFNVCGIFPCNSRCVPGIIYLWINPDVAAGDYTARAYFRQVSN